MGIAARFEKSTMIDLLTVGVLGYDGFLLYNNLGFAQTQVLSPSANAEVLAVQLTGALILIYGLETLYDKARSGSSGLGH